MVNTVWKNEKFTLNLKNFFRETNLHCITVWKSQDFCVNQILREINFVDSRSAKMAFLPF